jgi:hypothetical protein
MVYSLWYIVYVICGYHRMHLGTASSSSITAYFSAHPGDTDTGHRRYRHRIHRIH